MIMVRPRWLRWRSDSLLLWWVSPCYWDAGSLSCPIGLAIGDASRLHFKQHTMMSAYTRTLNGWQLLIGWFIQVLVSDRDTPTRTSETAKTAWLCLVLYESWVITVKVPRSTILEKALRLFKSAYILIYRISYEITFLNKFNMDCLPISIFLF